LNSAHFISQCSLVIYVVQIFLIDDIHLSIFSLKNVITLIIDHLTEKTSAGHSPANENGLK